MKTVNWYIVHIFVLIIGTVFSWTTVVVDFLRFYENEGTIFKITDCLYPNPVTTPCFYGAFAFAGALAWAIAIAKKEGEAQRRGEKNLMMFLIAGTLFAWGNFTLLLYRFYTALPGEGVGCSGVPASSPFSTPCFYGSVLFLLALMVSLVILRKKA